MECVKTLMVGAVALMALGARAAVECSTWAEMSKALKSSQDVVLTADIAQGANGQLHFTSACCATLDLNGHTITGSTNPGDAYRVFGFSGAAQLTIRDSSPGGGGLIDGQNLTRSTNGGLARLDNASASLVIKGGTIANFAVTGTGGAIDMGKGTVVISGGTITNCTAAKGGGLAMNAGTLSVTGGTFSGNTAAQDGGGIYCVVGSATVEGGVFANNTAKYGAALYARYGGTRLTVKGGTFRGNRASGSGHIAMGYGGASVAIQGGLFRDNGGGGELRGLTVTGGLFDSATIGCLASGYAATPVAGTSLYLAGLNVTTNPKGELLSGSMGCDPSARLYNEAGVRLAEGCHVTRSGTGYVLVSVNGIVLQGSVNEAIAFHGFLKKPDGAFLPKDSTVKIDFKLYPSANADAELLWARRIAVTIDEYSGYYVDITDAAGQSYQAAGGVEPTCATLRAALARHAQLSAGPVWIAYEPVSATVTTPFPRVPLHLQPIAQRASSAQRATAAAVGTVEAASFATATNATVAAERVFIDTDLASINGFTVDVPNRDIALNKSGAVKLRGVTGLTCSAATNTLGALARDLPATADSDCGRVVKHSVNGVEMQTAIYYSKGDATALPEGATNVYVWSFGPLVEK